MTKKRIIGQCKICDRQQITLIRGHIIPDWAYRLGDLQEGHFLPTLTKSSLFGPTPPATSPPTEFLFCGDCEHWLGQAEDELRRTFFSSNSTKDKTKAVIHLNQLPYFEIESPNRYLIERAIVGILYKAHFCDKQLFQSVKFSSIELNQFKESLLKGGPKGDNFDFLNLFFLKLYSFHEELNNTSKGALSSQALRQTEAATVIVFAGLGVIIARNKPKSLTDNNLSGRICDLEDLGFPFNFPDFSRLHNLKFDQKRIIELWKAVLTYNHNLPCPCGLSWTENKKVKDQRRTFGDCCKLKWFKNITFLALATVGKKSST